MRFRDFLNESNCKTKQLRLPMTESEYVQPKTTNELAHIIKDYCEENSWNSDLNFIDTSLITDMSSLFKDMTQFNGKIGNWDTSKVTNMHCMFVGAKSFNQPIGNRLITAFNSSGH